MTRRLGHEPAKATRVARMSIDRRLFWAVAAVALAFCLLVALGSARAVHFESWTDENVHLYVANRVAQGAVLYRDIHSARPPLAILPLAALLRAGIPPLAAARGLVVGSNLAIAALLLLAGRRLFGTSAGVLGAVLYLLAGQVAARNAYTGIHLVALGAAAAAIFVLVDRPLSAGIAAGLALAAGQHAAVIVGMAGIFAAARGIRPLLRYLAGAALSLGVLFGFVVARGGSGVFEDLVGKHLYHVSAQGPGATSDIGWWMGLFALEDAAFVVLALVGTFSRGASGSAPKKKGAPAPSRRFAPALALALFTAVHLIAVAAMKGGLALYLFPAMPHLALLAGAGAQSFGHWLGSTAPKVLRWSGAAALLAILLSGWWLSKRLLDARDNQHYPVVPMVRHVAMARVQRLVWLESIAAAARELPPDKTVFGHSTLAGPVALRSGRRVSGELADLAPRWFSTGVVRREEVLAAIERDSVGLLVTPRFAFVRDPIFKSYLERCFERPSIFPRAVGPGSGIPDILVYRRRDVARPCL